MLAPLSPVLMFPVTSAPPPEDCGCPGADGLPGLLFDVLCVSGDEGLLSLLSLCAVSLFGQSGLYCLGTSFTGAAEPVVGPPAIMTSAVNCLGQSGPASRPLRVSTTSFCWLVVSAAMRGLPAP